MQPQTEHIRQEVRRFIAHEYLEGDDEDLGPDSPLLEWGILDSIAMVSLVSFLEERFGIRVAQSDITPDNFRNLERISSMVVLRSTQPPAMDGDVPAHDAFELSQLEDFGAERVWTKLEQGGELHSVQIDGPEPSIWILPEPGEGAHAYGDMQRALEGLQRSVAVDLPGFGMSHGINSEPNFWDHAELLTGLVRRSLDTRIVLVGHGLSAALAMEVSQHVPERVAVVIALGYGALSDPQRLLADSDPKEFLAGRRNGSMRHSDDLLASVSKRIGAPAFGSFLDAEARKYLPHLPAKVTTPMLWIGGLDDRLVERTATERAAARAPQGHTKWLARSGHSFPMERPDETVSMICRYLADLEKDTEHDN